tara:strand:+ start:2732 stop:2959 length:228 start_codon:yes stop_codon:yes gene_type:complete
MNNIGNNMIFKGNVLGVCNHYCKNKPYKGNFYNWFSYLDHEFIKTMCEKCALRETWGYNYKQRTKYKKWLDSSGL